MPLFLQIQCSWSSSLNTASIKNVHKKLSMRELQSGNNENTSIYLFVFCFLLFCMGDFHYSFFHVIYALFCITCSAIDPLMCFSFQLLYSSVLTGSSLYFLVPFQLKFSPPSSILFPNSVSILITNALNTLSGKLYFSVSLIVFSGVFSCNIN